MSGEKPGLDLEEALKEAALEEQEELALRIGVQPEPVAPPIHIPQVPPGLQTAVPKRPPAEEVSSEEAFLMAVEELLVAIAPRRADHKPFDDRCLACERRGVHKPTLMRCGCPCHKVRGFLV